MEFDPENPVIKACLLGVAAEGQGRASDAHAAYLHAWSLASDDFERFTAAHYVARHQPSVADKLVWDQIALENALRVEGIQTSGSLASLYLNVAKCHEDLGDRAEAVAHYRLAEEHAELLPAEGYGEMVRAGVRNGLERMAWKVD